MLVLSRSDHTTLTPLHAGSSYRIGSAAYCEIHAAHLPTCVAQIDPRSEIHKRRSRLVLHYVPYWENAAGVYTADRGAATEIDVGDVIEHGGITFEVHEHPAPQTIAHRAAAATTRLLETPGRLHRRLAISPRARRRISGCVKHIVDAAERFDLLYIPIRRLHDRKVQRMREDLKLARSGGKHDLLMARLSAVAPPAPSEAAHKIFANGLRATGWIVIGYLLACIGLLLFGHGTVGEVGGLALIVAMALLLTALTATFFYAAGGVALALLATLCGAIYVTELGDLDMALFCALMISAPAAWIGLQCERNWRPTPYPRDAVVITNGIWLCMGLTAFADSIQTKNSLFLAFGAVMMGCCAWGLLAVSYFQNRVMTGTPGSLPGAAGVLLQLNRLDRFRALTLLDVGWSRWRKEFWLRSLAMLMAIIALLAILNSFDMGGVTPPNLLAGFEVVSVMSYPALIFTSMGLLIVWNCSAHGALAIASGFWLMAGGVILSSLAIMALPLPGIERAATPLPLRELLQSAATAATGSRAMVLPYAILMMSLVLYFLLIFVSPVLLTLAIVAWRRGRDGDRPRSLLLLLVLLAPLGFVALLFAMVALPSLKPLLIASWAATAALSWLLILLFVHQNLWNVSRGQTLATLALAIGLPAIWSAVESVTTAGMLHVNLLQATTLFVGALIVLPLKVLQERIVRASEYLITRRTSLSDAAIQNVVAGMDAVAEPHLALKEFLSTTDLNLSCCALYRRQPRTEGAYVCVIDNFDGVIPRQLQLTHRLIRQLAAEPAFVELPLATRDWRYAVTAHELWRMWRRFGGFERNETPRCRFLFPVHLQGALRGLLIISGHPRDHVRSHVGAARLREVCNTAL